ncbi:FAD/NAD(P)-binding domain-containing protein [Mycena venus]|uniref:FAD/NAD(P)-binding domain-containing protein n=1 Tax=Mycena venus TaxID=2733690 RepID=A0A8H6XPK5_9AGAR|nr:FAD/NAD(P)-binding domain-containing protein [Mycena venus]
MSSPLDILIIGAGLGGLAAAAALRQQGHHITIFERSAVNKEFGAAIAMQANAIRVLEYLGFRKENLRITHFESDGQPSSRSFTTSQGGFFCHRVDLHDELKRLATDPDGVGKPAKLILGSQVVKCEAIEGTITLKNGDVIHADLIIGADGIHSTVRKDVLGYPVIAAATGISAFSFSFSASKLEGRPELNWFTQGVCGGRVVTCQGDYNRRLFLCCCRDGTVVSVAALFTDKRVQEQFGWKSAATVEDVVSEFSDFHPKFRQMLALAEQPIHILQRRDLPLLPTWVKGRVALLGDAAHAMFSTLGQGAAMALEDAVTLGCLFPREIKREDIQSRLEAYQYLRKPRGEFISREALEQITVPEKRELFALSPEMRKIILDYDAVRVAEEYCTDCSNKL